ncbi:MAG TPA: adenylate/guanylate cyclase domain-containing protein [Thermohalobaculum sp.]|nr:adenylate/guanylate cyclase domain-containing protein [Thermohalobaculum sp.]
MRGKHVERRLAAILAADVVGYSRLVAADEAGTLAALRALRSEILDPAVAEHGGRMVKTTGDGFLVEFPSAVDAMGCAMGVQSAMAARDGRLRLRIGVNVGDVVIEGTDILGDGVNIAARLESVAEPGGVAFSGSVREYVLGRIDADFRDGGSRELKNIDRPIQVWHWQPEGAAPARAEAPALPDKPSIVVLPFDNMSGDPEQEYFADGVVEALTAALSRIRAFFVIARNSAFAYKGRHLNVREIGRELGVAYVLEGSVQRAGNRVRITVQLIETAGGKHLWAERYDGSLDDIFDLQDKITEQVAGALQPSIRLAEIERARRKRPQEMGAYDYTMRAIRHVWMLEKDEAAKALELLEKALEIDPEYPLALALAAWCWAQRSVYNWTDDFAAAKARALALGERAASLSSDDPLILAVLGAVHTFARNYGAARVLLERAIQLDPNAAWALSRLGWLEVYADRPDAAREYFERAMRLSPLDPMNFNNLVGLGSACQVAGDDNGAADLFTRALQERPNAHWIHRNLAAALHGAGREAEARASRNALLAAYPDMTVRKFKDAMVFSPRALDRMGAQLLEIGLPEA